jgi:hypothetical protein
MVTRKAIVAAFEAIVNDPKTKTAVVFCPDRPAVPTFKMNRVRVTRVGNDKSGQHFRVALGRINYAERQFIARHISKTHKTPKVWIVPTPKRKVVKHDGRKETKTRQR